MVRKNNSSSLSNLNIHTYHLQIQVSTFSKNKSLTKRMCKVLTSFKYMNTVKYGIDVWVMCICAPELVTEDVIQVNLNKR